MNFVKKITSFFLDSIVPQEHRIEQLLSFTPDELRSLLPRSHIHNEDIYALFDYRNKAVKLLVKALKYKNNREVCTLLAGYLSDELVDLASDIFLFAGKPPIILPMPMSAHEVHTRGFNQCEKLLKSVERHNKNIGEYLYDALIKIRETPRQASLNRENRLHNVSHSMVSKEIVRERICIVIDDVYTTGASFQEAKRALLSSGARRVYGVFIAH